MNRLINFVRSLLLTGLVSFTCPWIVVGGLMAGLFLVGYVPGFTTFSQLSAEQVSGFLATFGNGQPLEGLLVIGATCALVGALFDAYTFYRYQNLRD